jgi:hypothetical protein
MRINGDAPSQGLAVNLIASTAADVAQVKLRDAHPRPTLYSPSPSLPPLARVVAFCGHERVESAIAVKENN